MRYYDEVVESKEKVDGEIFVCEHWRKRDVLKISKEIAGVKYERRCVVNDADRI